MSLKKKRVALAVILNVIVFIASFIKFAGNTQQDITINDIALYGAQGQIEAHNIFKDAFPIGQYYLSAETGTLKSGVYSVTVQYKTEDDYFHLRCIGIADGNKYPVIYADEYDLDHAETELSFHMWVNDNIDNMQMRITYVGTMGEQENPSLYVDKIEVRRDYKCTVVGKLLRLMVILFALNSMAVIIVHRDWIRRNYYVILGLTCVFMITSLSLFSNSQPAGLDIDFHYGRIIGLAEGIKAGNFPVRIQPGWINDYGYASSVFYGDLLLYISAILYAFKMPLVHVYKLYVLVINLGTVLIAYWCFKKQSGDKYIGVTCTALYCLSINRILNVMYRGAVGEYSAFMFLPLVLAGIRDIYMVDGSENSKNGWIFLCLGMTGIIQTHIQSLEMVCIILFIAAILMLKKTLHKEVLLSIGQSVLVTIFLNMNYLVPFLDYMREDINVFAKRVPQPNGNQELGLSIYELFSYETTAFGHAIPSTQSLVGRIPESLGISMVIIILLSITLLVRGVGREWMQKRELLLATSLAGIAIYLSTYYFPWNRLLAIPFIQNVASSIQFPWRFLGIAVLLLTYMACLVFIRLKNVIRKEQIQLLLMGVCLICAVQGLKCTDLIVRSCDGNIKYDGRWILDDRWTLISGEFLLQMTNINMALEDSDVHGKNVEIYRVDRKGTRISISCQGEEDAYIDFPLFAYNHYKCIDADTGEEFPVVRGENNKIRVNLSDNYEGNLKVYFAEPWYWRTAELISISMAIVFIICCCRKMRFYARRKMVCTEETLAKSNI